MLTRLRGRAHFPAPVRVVLAMAFVSSLGTGLTIPFLLVYLHAVRGVPLAVTGILIAVPGFVTLASVAFVGTLTDRRGPRVVLAGALGCGALGSVLLVLAHGPLSALPALVLVGLSNAGIQNGSTTCIGESAPDGAIQSRVYSHLFVLGNLGIALGGFAASRFVSLRHAGTFDVIYLLDAVSFAAPAVVALVALPRRQTPSADDTPSSTSRRPSWAAYRKVLANTSFVRYLLVLGAIEVVGLGAFNAGYVGYSVSVLHVAPSLVADAFALNGVAIIALQHPWRAVIDRLPRQVTLALAVAAFAAAWGVEFGASATHGTARDVLVVLVGPLFALGEMSVMPVRFLLVNVMASDELRGRYNATASAALGAADVVAPSLIGVALGAAAGGPLMAGLVGASLLVGAGALSLKRRLAPYAPTPPEVASGPTPAVEG